MSGRREMTEVELRKQALLLESQLNRLALGAEWGQLRGALSWVGYVKEAQRRMRPWLWRLARVAIALVARRFRGRESNPGFWGRAIELVLGLIELRRAWASKPKEKA